MSTPFNPADKPRPTFEDVTDPAERAALKAVDLVFLHLGVDIDDPVQVRALKERLDFLARAERGAREVKSAAVKTCVGALITGFIAILVLGVREQLAAWLR